MVEFELIALNLLFLAVALLSLGDGVGQLIALGIGLGGLIGTLGLMWRSKK